MTNPHPTSTKGRKLTPTHVCQAEGCNEPCHRKYCHACSYQVKLERERKREARRRADPVARAKKAIVNAAWKQNNPERNAQLARQSYHRCKAARQTAPVVSVRANLVLDMSIKDPIERVVDLARRKAMAAGDPGAEYIR